MIFTRNIKLLNAKLSAMFKEASLSNEARIKELADSIGIAPNKILKAFNNPTQVPMNELASIIKKLGLSQRFITILIENI